MKLCRTSDSLGGKGVLWELFSFNRASLTLYVNLCANSPYLSNILNRNPGMIDELMDGLMLKKLPEFQQQEAALLELCGGAEDIDPMIHSFNKSKFFAWECGILWERSGLKRRVGRWLILPIPV